MQKAGDTITDGAGTRAHLSNGTARRKNIVGWLRRLWSDDGSQLIEVALTMPILMLMVAGTADFGRAYFAAIEVSAAAEAGAAYGVQNPTDTAGMQSAATLDAPDLSTMSATASYGSECSDGTLAIAGSGTPATCSMNSLQYVEVDTSLTYKPLFAYPGLPTQIVLKGKSRMRASF